MVNYRPHKLSLYSKTKDNSSNLLISKPSFELNEIAEAISQKQIISNINSPLNSSKKVTDIDGDTTNNFEENFDNFRESTADNLTNNSSCSKKERVAPNLKNIDLKYLKKNSDGNFLSYNCDK